MDRTIKLFNKKACRNLSELPAAMDLLDTELRADEELSGHKLPDHTKIAFLVRLFPEKYEKDMKHRWIMVRRALRRSAWTSWRWR